MSARLVDGASKALEAVERTPYADVFLGHGKVVQRPVRQPSADQSFLLDEIVDASTFIVEHALHGSRRAIMLAP